MSLEIRAAATPHSFDLFERDERIGEIRFVPAYVEHGDLVPDQWEVEVWSLMGTGKTWRDTTDSDIEAMYEAREAYVEFVAERRRINQGPSRVRTVSTPMGGQRRK